MFKRPVNLSIRLRNNLYTVFVFPKIFKLNSQLHFWGAPGAHTEVPRGGLRTVVRNQFSLSTMWEENTKLRSSAATGGVEPSYGP